MTGDADQQAALAKNIDWDSVARYYDAYVRTDVDLSFFLQQARAAGGPILEVMCGTGRLTVPLAEAGFSVTALDSSAELLARLRSKLADRHPQVRVIEADARTFDLGQQFPFVFVGFHSFAELLGRSARSRAMATIRKHVASGGRFVLTLHNPPIRVAAAHADWRSMGRFALEPGVSLEVSSRWNVDREVARIAGVQRYRELDERGHCMKELYLPIVFDLITPAEVRDLAEEAGFEIADVFGDYAGAAFDGSRSPFAIFNLRRR